jgi:DNA mismatch repair protein MutS2
MRKIQSIHPKVLQDVEFDEVLNQISDFAQSDEAKKLVKNITPDTVLENILQELNKTNEYLSALESDNPLPHHYITPFNNALKKLGIENSFIEPKALLNIAQAVDIISKLHRFFTKFKTYFPHLLQDIEQLTIHRDIYKLITTRINQYAELKDEASPLLRQIRKEIEIAHHEILQIFSQEKNKYNRLGLLSDIKESIIDERNVLAVKAAHRKKIKGSILGTSKTGSIVFIEPEATAILQKKLFGLKFDEKQETIRILKEITNELRPYNTDLQEYNKYLITLDLIAAKAKYAEKLQAVKPEIRSEKNIKLVNAYHPLLKITNEKLGLPVVPQHIELNPEKRIIIISGPNAGGKSISLKTVGLLQVMIQSGILVPVHPDSKFTIFKNILTDIGDNQSIADQLSTYSYRLKNMRNFLRKINSDTLFLIDEFGTGSDPELGGALAEAFLEAFYQKGAFGIITTHYNNLKLVADKYPEIANAYMEFDLRNLQPTYRLHIGQPGSSFTFEVAQKIGIPYSIINKAKKKVSKKKVKFDETLTKMQREIKKMKDLQKEYDILKNKLESEQKEHIQLNKSLLQKLNRFNKLYQLENDILKAGEKINKLFDDYFQHQNAKKLTAQVFKWAEIEKNKKFPQLNKVKKQTQQQKLAAKKEKKEQEKLKKEVTDELEVKNVAQELEKIEIKTMNFVPKIGDQVRIKGSQANATVEKLEKNKALLNYGRFTASVPIKDLELVLRK